MVYSTHLQWEAGIAVAPSLSGSHSVFHYEPRYRYLITNSVSERSEGDEGIVRGRTDLIVGGENLV